MQKVIFKVVCDYRRFYFDDAMEAMNFALKMKEHEGEEEYSVSIDLIKMEEEIENEDN